MNNHMQRRGAVAIASLLLYSMLLGALPGVPGVPGAWAGSRIVCDEPNLEFGTLDNSQTVEHVFILRNDGDSDLVIDKVKPSCGCTVADLSTKILTPGSEALLTVRLSLKGRKGVQRKSVRVYSNDVDQPNLRLTLSGEAIAPINVSPGSVHFGKLEDSSSVRRTVLLTASPGMTFHVEQVEPGGDQFDVKMTPIEHGQSYKLTVSTKPPLAEGTLRQTVRIRTNLEQYRYITIRISGQVVGELAVSPRQIVLLNTGTTEPLTRYLIIAPGKTKQFNIMSIEPPDTSVKVKTTPIAGGGYRVQLKGLVADGSLNGKSIVIKTDTKGMKEIVIPIRVEDKKQAGGTK